MGDNNGMTDIVHQAIDDTQIISYNFALSLLQKFPAHEVIDILQGEVKKLNDKNKVNDAK